MVRKKTEYVYRMRIYAIDQDGHDDLTNEYCENGSIIVSEEFFRLKVDAKAYINDYFKELGLSKSEHAKTCRMYSSIIKIEVK